MLTGNYNFFNLLTILLCVFLFDDAALRSVIPARVAARIAGRAPRGCRWATASATVIALIVVPVGIDRVWELLSAGRPSAGRRADPRRGAAADRQLLRAVREHDDEPPGNRRRRLERRRSTGASTNSTSSRATSARAPSWNIPHQPRLDWQMWFAALSGPRRQPWFAAFLYRLLENSPPVLALLASNPFPDGPPAIRARHALRLSIRRGRAACDDRPMVGSPAGGTSIFRPSPFRISRVLAPDR